MGKVDFYFSESLHKTQMNPLNWCCTQDSKMPVVEINGEFVPYSERITHGNEPVIKESYKDLVLLATLEESAIKTKVVDRLNKGAWL